MEFNIFSFPFEQIGWGLRQLSLSGAVGNFFAILLYLLLGSIPAGMYLYLKKQGKNRKIDYMLFVMSGVLLFVLYYMINPDLLPVSVLDAGKALLGGTFYSVVVGYFVLRVMLGEQKTELRDLQKSLRVVLILVIFLLVGSVMVEIFVNLPTAIWNVQEGNYVSDPLYYEEPDLTITFLCLALRYVVNILPNALGAVGVFFCIQTLDELIVDAYSKKAALIRKVVVFCRNALVVIVSAGMICNLLQMLLSSKLYQMHISVNIPLFAILFLLAIHVLARYIEENQKLKEDNDLFI